MADKFAPIPYDWKNGYPARSDLFFECTNCQTKIPSLPENSVACTCGNIRIDVDAGRISVRDHDKLRLLQKR